MIVDRLLEGIDLTALHTILTVAGALLAVYVMQLTHYEAEDMVDPWIVRKMRRLSLALIALAQLGSALYSLSHQWSPWPPELLLIFAVNLALVIRMVAIWARIKRTGHRCWDRPSAIRQSMRKG
jgi:hypothetical protein